MSPRAVVAMATYNPDPGLLRRQVESLRSQTEEDWVCLVLDDDSDSESRAVVRNAVAADPRFRLLPGQAHAGHFRTFERLVGEATAYGVPVLTCDQDDYWYPAKIQRSLQVLDRGADGVFVAMRMTRADGTMLRERFLQRSPTVASLTPASLLLMNCVSGTSLAVTHRIATRALPFPQTGTRPWHDQWMAATAARIGRLEYLDEALVDYTRHSGQVVGEGLRRITPDTVRAYRRRVRASHGLRQDLTGRVAWITAAAQSLAAMPGPDDSDLQDLAGGRVLRLLPAAVAHGRVPVTRAGLLALGSLAGRRRPA